MKEKIHRILAINPGSTSTKIGVFDDEKCVVEKVIRHTREELDACGGVGVYNQKNLRRRLVLETLSESGISLESLDATVGRAARLPPMASGTYAINAALMQAIPDPLPSPGLLGMVIAKELGDELKIPSFIVDPANVDEFWELSRVTGIPDISRISSFHTLNHKAVGRRAAAELGKSYDDCRFVIAHMGGGMSIAAHLYGRVVDSTHGNNGEGSYTPERAGYIPGLQLVKLCFSGKYSQDELENFFIRRGGMLLYLGTTDMREAESRMQAGDEKARLIFEAMAYNVAKTIGSMYAVLSSDIDAIVLTGGLAHSERFCKRIVERIGKMGRVIIYPGEDELLAMTQGVLRVIKDGQAPLIFAGK